MPESDYRALCAELVESLENARRIIQGADGTLHINTAEFVLRRARAALAQPEPVAPTAWMYQGEPDFDGEHWRENWKTTLDEKLAHYMSGKKEPIPLWCRPTPQPQPVAPTNEELDDLFVSIDEGASALNWRTYARAVLARWGTPANTINHDHD
jgi:hypothetical protein